MQIDLLVIKKSAETVIQNDIGQIFSHHNIMEFKSPRDRLSVNDYFKVLAYVCLYKAQEGAPEDLRSDDVTISLVRDTKPAKLMEALEKQGMEIYGYSPGIYYVRDAWFPMQIIVTSELEPQEHRWMRALTENLSCDEAGRLLHEASAFSRTEDEPLVESVMTVSIAANKIAFRDIKEEQGMYQFVRELFGDEILAEKQAAIRESRQEWMREGRQEGMREGRQEGMREANEETAKRLLKRGRLTHEEIAEDSDLSLEEVEKLARELFSDLQLI